MPIDRRVFCAATRRFHRRPGTGAVQGRDLGRRRHPAADRDRPLPRRRHAPASRPRPSSAPISSAAAPSAASTTRPALDESSQPGWGEWRARAADALVAGSVARLADGRFDLRFKLWDVVKGSDLGGQSNAVEAAELRLARASHRRLRLREADRREGRVLDPDRLRHPGRLAAHAARRRCRRRERPGRAQQRPADHLAGLVAERQGARLRLVREARRRWSSCTTWPPASAARSPTSAARTARRPGRPTARRWR